jgi:hypothetical protein
MALEMEFSESLWIVGWIFLHTAGIFAGWATRLVTGSRLDLLLQVAFFTLLCGLSGVAWWSHQLEHGLWIPTGFTMVAMVLMAVTDLRSGDRHGKKSPAGPTTQLY